MIFKKSLPLGRRGEALITKWLREKDYTVIPSYAPDDTIRNGARIFTPTGELITPDLLAWNGENPFFAEAKYKEEGCSWYSIAKCWCVGMDLNKYEHYIKVEEHFRWDVWIMFILPTSIPSKKDTPFGCPKECPIGLYGAEIKQLAKHEHHRGKNPDCVYWHIDSLTRLQYFENQEDMNSLKDQPH